MAGWRAIQAGEETEESLVKVGWWEVKPVSASEELKAKRKKKR